MKIKNIYDLTHGISKKTFHPFGSPQFESYETFEVQGCRSSKVTITLHFATHLDSPWHSVRDGKKLEDLSLDRFVGEGLVVDLSDKYGPSCGKNLCISQKLADGRQHCTKNFIPTVEDVTRKIPSTSLIARVDGGYMSDERLNWIVEKKLQVISVVNWDDFLSNNKDIKVDGLFFEHFYIEEEDEKTQEKVRKKISVAPVGIRRVYSKSRYQFQAVLVKVKQEQMPIKKRRKYFHYVIVHNVGGLTDARSVFEFYHQRQTIESFFKESKNPLHSGKMPSLCFRSNEAYLHFVSLAYNIFSIFKKTICQRYGKDALLKFLAIEPSVMQSE